MGDINHLVKKEYRCDCKQKERKKHNAFSFHIEETCCFLDNLSLTGGHNLIDLFARNHFYFAILSK